MTAPMDPLTAAVLVIIAVLTIGAVLYGLSRDDK